MDVPCATEARATTQKEQEGYVRIAAVIAGICAQLIGAVSWAADPPEACLAELTDAEVSVATTADTDDEKVSEIVGQIVAKLPNAFAIPRHEELEQIVT